MVAYYSGGVIRLVSNAKSSDGRFWCVELSPRTVLLGENDAGKNAVMAGLTHAVGGFVGNERGKDAIQASAQLLRMAQGGPFVSTAIWADGGRSVTTNAPGRATVSDGPRGVFPGAVLREGVVGRSDAASNKFLLHAFLGDTLTDAALLAKLPEDLRGTTTELLDEVTATEPLERLAALGEQVKRRVDAASTGAVPVMPKEPRPGDIELLEDVVRRLGALGQQQARRDGRIEGHLTAAGLETPAAKVLLATMGPDALRQALAEKEAALAALDRPVKPQRPGTELLGQLHNVITAHRDKGVQDCLVCTGRIAEGVLMAQLEKVERQQNKRQKEAAAAQDAHQDALTDWGVARTALQAQIGKISALRRASELMAIPVTTGEDTTFFTSPAVTALLASVPEESKQEALQQRLSASMAAQVAWRRFDDDTADAAQRGANAAVYRRLQDALTSAVGQLMTDAVGNYEYRVQRYLPTAWPFQVILEKGTKGAVSPRFGFIEGTEGTFIEYMGGSRWMTLLTAMAAVSADQRQAARSIYLPQDVAEVALAPQRLAEVMRALTTIPGQVILSAVAPPKGKTPAGWTVVNVAERAWFGSAEEALRATTAAPTGQQMLAGGGV